MQSIPQWLFWAGLSAIFAALTALFAKMGVKGVDPDLAMSLRTLVVAAVILPLVVATGKWSNPLLLPGRTQLFLVLSALATGASWLFYFRALQVGELAKVAVVDKLSVVLAVGLAFLLLGERPAPREWAGIGLVLAGVIVLATRK
ncbi:transporter [Stenotrophomonas maltophilia]|uniref:EamA family transporter n=1 Tax=Stenotrophomonas TaxID=40323 RepID=UPI000B4E086F|nr:MULTISPECIES: EamA family transporter [Stenotrophomonas]MPS45276.1 EamA family transporter [Stenotrophomonas sp.]MBA0382261.1 EamA family transporter [Stenotrophomonas maltophilia]MBH1634904.1 EamA family transporter [Stenotrophomonas maltophilia]OWQ82358.1 transporter [Stenotrophomonas maltophilia]PJL00304.1 transporter [Stenotrophomonas maltophilia]